MPRPDFWKRPSTWARLTLLALIVALAACPVTRPVTLVLLALIAFFAASGLLIVGATGALDREQDEQQEGGDDVG